MLIRALGLLEPLAVRLVILVILPGVAVVVVNVNCTFSLLTCKESGCPRDYLIPTFVEIWVVCYSVML